MVVYKIKHLFYNESVFSVAFERWKANEFVFYNGIVYL